MAIWGAALVPGRFFFVGRFPFPNLGDILPGITGGITHMQDNELLPVSNVHDALTRAVESRKAKVNLINQTFKCHPVVKELGAEICEKHGIDLSEFLRECLNALVRDYVGPDRMIKLGIDPPATLPESTAS